VTFKKVLDKLVRETMRRFTLGNWSVKVVIDNTTDSTARTESTAEYLEVDFTFNPDKVDRHGYDLKALVEHEVLHLCFLPITQLAHSLIRQHVTDVNTREYLMKLVDFNEHQALERIHRGFNPRAIQRTGDLNPAGED